MSEVKWIKITTDIFDDEKILLIESLPDAYEIIVIWFKLLCLAGKMNNNGIFIMNDRIAYTDKMLATVFRMKESTVQLALKTFEKFGMVKITDGVISISNWGKHQNIEGMEKIRESKRLAQARWREKKRYELAETSSVDSTVDSTRYLVDDADIDKEEDKERDKDKDNNTSTIVDVSPSCGGPSDVKTIVDAWNSIGLNQIRGISAGSTRRQMLSGRIKESGVDAILEAIENIKKSEFLKGQNKRGWTVTFDWFIKPSNFQKVLEGNYSREAKAQDYSRFGVQTYEKDDFEDLL